MTAAYVPGCTGKRKFASEDGALAAADRPHTRIALKRGEQLHPYQCPACGCWHLSRKTQEQADRQREASTAAAQRRQRAAERNRQPLWERLHRPMPAKGPEDEG